MGKKGDCLFLSSLYNDTGFHGIGNGNSLAMQRTSRYFEQQNKFLVDFLIMFIPFLLNYFLKKLKLNGIAAKIFSEHMVSLRLYVSGTWEKSDLSLHAGCEHA